MEKRGGKSKHFNIDLKKILDTLNPENQDKKIEKLSLNINLRRI